jgi:XisI protein
MARLEQYRHLIQRILTQYAQIPPAYGEIERQTIFDTERDHYQLVNTGWETKNFGFNTMAPKPE